MTPRGIVEVPKAPYKVHRSALEILRGQLLGLRLVNWTTPSPRLPEGDHCRPEKHATEGTVESDRISRRMQKGKRGIPSGIKRYR